MDKRIDYDEDDFLDSLMEDVMGTNDEEEYENSKGEVEDEFSEHDKHTEGTDDDKVNEEENEQHIEQEDTHEVEENTHEIEKEIVEKPRRAGGLLGQLGGQSKQQSDGESEIDVDESLSREETEDTLDEKGIEEISGEVESEDETEFQFFRKSKNTESTYESEDGDDIEQDVSSDEIPAESDEDYDGFTEEEFDEDEATDLLDAMLESLDEDEDVDEIRRRSGLDTEVEVPLEKPGMDEIVVTSDGRTLAEMLPGMRRGTKSTSEVIDKIRNQEDVIEVNGKKFTDDRYTKHAKVIDEEVARDEERVRLSMKYLQKNAEFTEQEKIIMRNLGLDNEQLAKVMRSKELSQKDKEKILALGRYGSEKIFKGRRYRTTVGDVAMLEFLTKFKFANTRILRWISNEPQGRTWRKLSRLRNSGLVESKSLIGVPDLWGATPSGVAIAGYAYEPGLRPMPKMFSISSNMGVNYLAACLWFNTVNVLNRDDFPAHNRIIALQDDGRDRVRGEMLISEYEIRSSLGKEINPQATTMKTLGDERLYDVISSNVRAEVKAWNDGGRIGDGPETMLGNEYMWVLYPTSQLTLSYHVPDLVVRRERGPNGEPRSIAVEMERFEKKHDRYDKIMLAYKLDEHLYEEVVWVTPNTRVARALERAANAVGFEKYRIIPIITESGVYTKQDIWMI